VNRALKRISLAVLIMFLLLMINVNYLQGFETASLASRPFNDRATSEANQYERGDITTSDGVLVAGDKLSSPDDSYKYQRYYTDGPVYAPVTGYDTIYSQSGVEEAEDSLLSGNGSQLAFRNFIDMITDKQQKGATVQLTVNSKAQTAAYNGLQQILQGTGRVGGVVALNPSTGAILAMASYPSYDPNQLATHNGTQLNTVDEKLLTENPSPLINNATQMTLPPGSTFKIVTSSAWFAQEATRTPQSDVNSPTTLTLPQTSNILHNDSDEACGNGSGTTTIEYAFAQSCDTTFGNLGEDLGTEALKNTADAFGFNSSVNILGVTMSPSQYILAPSAATTAYTAIGQFDDTATPLQEAMLASAIADNGTLMKPYLIQQVTASDLSVVYSAPTTQLSQPVSPAVANNVKQMMIAVTQQPEGTGFQFNANNEGGLVIAGKTGTAQNGINATGLNDAVFTAFAPASNPKIAVGVMVQGAGYGAAEAAPIAVSVIRAYLASVGAGG
jgi:penicillin-binding protein A